MTESSPIGLSFQGWRATGVGSLPDSDPDEAAAVIAGELAQWPHLPELPARGPGAEMVGRAMHLLAGVSNEFAVETAAGRWRRTTAPGRDMRRAESFFSADCDAAAERFADCAGPFTVPLAGPWTLAAVVVDQWGERTLRDRGYVADLCQAHAEAARVLVARFKRLLPAARIVVFLDEPFLAAVHDGEVPFSSGYRRHRSVTDDELLHGLQPVRDAVRAAGGSVGVHCCADPVWSVVSRLRPDAISLDVGLLTEADTEQFGTWLESGAATVWGAWPSSRPAASDQAARSLGVITGWLGRLGMSPARMSGPMAVSPACGLAGVTSGQARQAMAGVREIAGRLGELE